MYDYRKLLISLNIVAILFVFIGVFLTDANLINFKKMSGYMPFIIKAWACSSPFVWFLMYGGDAEEPFSLILNIIATLLIPVYIFHFKLFSQHPFPYFGYVALFALVISIMNIFFIIKRDK